MIYLDNAATTMRKPQAVIDAVTEAMSSLGNASRGAHEGALASSRIIYRARTEIAELFHCPRADHVVFTANSTEALNIAINGAVPEGSHVVTTELEHNSVLRPLYRLEAEGKAQLSFVPADRRGCVDYDDFERLIRPETSAIVCTHASNLTGNRLDLRRIGELAARHGLLFIVDASQTAGAAEIDMEGWGISILCFTGHKSMMGPQGTGGMCIREGVEVRPFKVGGSGVQSYLKTQPAEYPTRLEAGTLNGHGIAGLRAAAAFLRETGIGEIEKRENALAYRFWKGASEIEGITLYGDFSEYECRGNWSGGIGAGASIGRCPIVSLNIHDLDSAVVSDELAVTYGIATRPGAHCAPLMHRALGTEAQGAVRFSFGWFNTEEEVDAALQALREIAEE